MKTRLGSTQILLRRTADWPWRWSRSFFLGSRRPIRLCRWPMPRQEGRWTSTRHRKRHTQCLGWGRAVLLRLEGSETPVPTAMAREHVSPYVCWYFSFSYLLPMGRTQASVRVCVRGMEDDPLNFMGGFHYAGALLAGGNTEAGEAYLRQLSDLYSNLYQSYY